MISYAQNFEDVMLERVFKQQATGFYIDIGVWDATADSVTKHFYDKGWSGINFEPLPNNYQRIVAARPARHILWRFQRGHKKSST